MFWAAQRWTSIAEQLSINLNTALKCRRFVELGVDGLLDEPRFEPRKLTDASFVANPPHHHVPRTLKLQRSAARE